MKEKLKYGTLAGAALLTGLYACAHERREVVINPSATNVGVATAVMNAGIDLGDPLTIPKETVEKILKNECEITIVGDFYNLQSEKREAILSCDIYAGNGETENKWRINVNSLCNVLYRDRDTLGIDVDLLKSDELYFATRDGTAFSLYMDEIPARSLAGFLSAYTPRNIKECVSLAKYELANYTPLGILEGNERAEAQQRYAIWFNEKGSPKYAVKGKLQEFP